MSRKILVLPGDGIGPEITAEAVRVLEALNKDGLNLEISTGLLGGCAVDATGEPYPAETRAKAEAADAVLLGAVGGPKWDTLPGLAGRQAGSARRYYPVVGLMCRHRFHRLFSHRQL
jgi:3-isopropylmalate dehydrogenase